MKTKFKLITAAISMSIALSAFADTPPVVTVENQTKNWVTFQYEVQHGTFIEINSIQAAPDTQAAPDWTNIDPTVFEFLTGFVISNSYGKDPNSSCLFAKDQFVNNKSYKIIVFPQGSDPYGNKLMVCKILTQK